LSQTNDFGRPWVDIETLLTIVGGDIAYEAAAQPPE
jgi:hypothetical protein